MEKNNLKKLGGKLGIIYDSTKAFLIVLIVSILILLLVSLIIHNVLRFGEVSSKYTGKYKHLYPVKDKMMNIYTIGESEKTIVMLPSYSVQTPVLEYKALADSLSGEYKIVIIEYFGYGFSLNTKDERTCKNIVDEIRKGLASAEIPGPYILMPFGISNIYSNYFCENFPQDISGVISVNGMYSEEIENSYFKNEYLPDLKSNVKFYSMLGFSGIFRWQSYLQPEKFNIDDLSKNKSYGEGEIKVYRNLLANKFLTKTMINEIENLKDNMEETKDYKYAETLPTLQILTTSKINEYNQRGEDIEKLSENVITNEEIQNVKVLDGELSDYLFKKTQNIKNLITLYF